MPVFISFFHFLHVGDCNYESILGARLGLRVLIRLAGLSLNAEHLHRGLVERYLTQYLGRAPLVRTSGSVRRIQLHELLLDQVEDLLNALREGIHEAAVESDPTLAVLPEPVPDLATDLHARGLVAHGPRTDEGCALIIRTQVGEPVSRDGAEGVEGDYLLDERTGVEIELHSLELDGLGGSRNSRDLLELRKEGLDLLGGQLADVDHVGLLVGVGLLGGLRDLVLRHGVSPLPLDLGVMRVP